MERQKAPFTLLYNNDCTNIEDCVSPFQEKEKAPFTTAKLAGSVDETVGTGVDVHLLSPGMGWVPWWKSKSYPATEHYQWSQETYGIKPDGYAQYMLSGGDITNEFVTHCRKRSMTPFITFRLNDAHHRDWVDMPPSKDNPSCLGHSLCRFYREHPEYRIAPDLDFTPGEFDWDIYIRGVQNWACPEVRNRKFTFIQEICDGYDIEGLELDFLRFYSFFPLDKTTSQQRSQIMTDFVQQVRKLLDRTARTGQHRWLCVRVPCYLSAHDMLGIDLPSFVDSGVDMVNLSAHYFADQPTELSRIREMIPDTTVYLEMCHTTSIGHDINQGPDQITYRRTTDEQYYTTAHLAYARGLDGISVFNFVYYRQHCWPNGGPHHEPPFHVFEHLGDRSWLAKQPQHYFVGYFWDQPVLDFDHQIPRTVKSGQTVRFRMDMAPPENGWKAQGKLRIQSARGFAHGQWTASINTTKLKQTDNIAEPYENPYPQLLGQKETLLGWTVPASLLHDGINIIEVTMKGSEAAEIVFVDIAMP